MNEPEETVTSNETEPAATTPPAAPAVSPPPSVAATAQAAAPRSSGRNWSGIALFLLGVLAGVLGFAIVARLTTTPAPDAVAMRDAARAGTLDAIATLQAGGPTAAQPNVTPTPAIVNADFAVRETNRLGNPDAPVTIVEFSDFQWPFCGRFDRLVKPEIIKQYVETGQANIVYKHSAFLGQESVWAAQAAECAADQGRFWDFHDILFERQDGENQGAFNQDKLIAMANELKFDMAKFEQCMNNNETLARVQADTQEGSAAGVTGTPTFFINGRVLVGAQPLEAFQQTIEQALQAQ